MFWWIVIVVFIIILFVVFSDNSNEKWIADCMNNIVAFAQSFENEFDLPIYTNGVLAKSSYMRQSICYYVELSGCEQREKYQLIINPSEAKAIAIFNEFSNGDFMCKKIYQYVSGHWYWVETYDRQRAIGMLTEWKANRIGLIAANDYYKQVRKESLEADLCYRKNHEIAAQFNIIDPNYNY